MAAPLSCGADQPIVTDVCVTAVLARSTVASATETSVMKLMISDAVPPSALVATSVML